MIIGTAYITGAKIISCTNNECGAVVAFRTRMGNGTVHDINNVDEAIKRWNMRENNDN